MFIMYFVYTKNLVKHFDSASAVECQNKKVFISIGHSVAGKLVLTKRHLYVTTSIKMKKLTPCKILFLF